MEKKLSLQQITKLEKYSALYSSYESEYIFAHITKQHQPHEIFSDTMRLDGMSIILCISGSIDIGVNLKTYRMTPNTLLVISPDSIINILSANWDELDAYLFIISREFISDINLDLNVINTSHYMSYNPMQTITANEMEMMRHYFDLIHQNTVNNTDDRYVRSISRCLLAAAIYQMMQFVYRHRDEDPAPLSRRHNYVKEFMQLVQTHHRSERGVAFYASRLFITPKYLSLIIKESTGKSAAEWIDEFVILEAKNLLRFSDKNIQQIAYELNFTNQSSFGKYFKHLTGVSPSKYQKS